MSAIATTKMSSKGQVVIPESIRKRLKIGEGARFIVVGEGDVVILKTIAAPTMGDYDRVIAEARRQAREAGLADADISEIVSEARKAKCG